MSGIYISVLLSPPQAVRERLFEKYHSGQIRYCDSNLPHLRTYKFSSKIPVCIKKFVIRTPNRQYEYTWSVFSMVYNPLKDFIGVQQQGLAHL